MKSLLQFITIFITLFIFSFQANAYVTKTGNVSGEYWHNTDTYYVTGVLTVDAGTSFEIQAGTRVKFGPSASIEVNGTIICNGNTTSNIIFTSMDDNSVGEVIAGSDGNPNPGDWGRIYVNGFSSADGIGIFNHVVFRYGGNSPGNIYFYYAGTASLQNCIIRLSDSYGIGDNGSNIDVDNCTISDNTTDGINCYMSSPDIDNCEFSNNGDYAAYIRLAPNLNIFANNTGSNNSINAFGISGTIDQNYTLSESVCGFPFVLVGTVTLNENYTMTIPAGEVIKAAGGGLIINGTLNAIGTNSQNIVFTSLKDDTYGGDLNGDGTATTPAKGDWSSIRMYGSSTKQGIGNMDYCKVLYAGSSSDGAVWFSRSDEGYFKNGIIQYSDSRGLYAEYDTLEVTNNQFLDNDLYGVYAYADAVMDLSNSTFNNNGNHGIYANGSGELQINNCQFNNNGGYAAFLNNIDNLPQFTNNSGSGNTINAFGIGGTINQDFILSQSITGFPFVIIGDLTMSDNYTLTIPPGEIIKLSGTAVRIISLGTLDAQGKDSEKIVFTSLKDDTFGGDLNGDGDATSPAPGDWAGLYIYGNGDTDGKGYFDHCIVRYAGTTINSYAAVYFSLSDTAFIKNSIVEYSQYEGIESNHSDVIIENCSINNNGTYGMYLVYGKPQINNCQINNNGDYAVYLANIDVGNYTGNTGSGNAINAFGINTGTIDQDLTLSASITGFPYVLLGIITVNDNVILTIPPGEIIKATGGNARFVALGTINAQGSETQKIVFTSFLDDTFGGDLNGDGNATSPAPGNWGGIYMSGIGDYDGKGYFDHCEVWYSGTSSNSYSAVTFNAPDSAFIKNSIIEFSQYEGIEADHCDLVVENCSMNSNGSYGIYINNGMPEINNCQFNNNGNYAAYLVNIDVGSYTGNTGSGNAINAFGINTGTIKQDLTLSESVTGFPYVLLGAITVNDNVTLTIPPGEIIKATGPNTRFILQGTINAQGLETQKIVFTSLQDDTFGGDLNGDGDATSPTPGDWAGIYMSGINDNDGNGYFDHCIVRYAGTSTNSYSAVNFNAPDSAFIKNSIIEFSQYEGIDADHCDLIVENCSMNSNGSYGIYIDYGKPEINNCQFNNNDSYAAYLTGVDIISYTNNSGTGNTINAFGISGNVKQNLTLTQSTTGFPYVLVGDVTVYDNCKLTFPPGEIIKLTGITSGIQSQGTIDAQGTNAQPIIFTSLLDDSLGGDLNGDGDATSPAPGNWEGILLNGSSDNDGNGFFDHCVIRYGGISNNSYSAINFNQSDSAFIKNSVVEYGLYDGLRSNYSSVLIKGNTFNENTRYGVNILGSSVPNLGQNNLPEAGLNTFINNDGGNIQLYNASSTEIDAYYNDWGYYTEAEIDAHIYDDDENAGYGQVHFNPWYDPSNPPFVVHFGADTLSGEAPLAVQFTDSTLFAANYWAWDFEDDGVVDSYDQNPSHMYFDGGTYSVKLKSSNGIDTDSLTRTDYINITPNQHLRSYALDFDGVDDYAEVSNFAYPEDLTIETWIKPENFDNTQEIIFWYGISDGLQLRLNVGGSLLFGENTEVSWDYLICDAGYIYLNQWNHLAVTKQGDVVNLYVNGVKVGSTQFDNNPVLENINFGARGVYGDRFFEGLIDEVRIWSTALTQSEIQANMTNYLAGTETGLLAYYRLNDVAGQTAWDFTGHGFDGQLGSSAGSDINDPAWVQTNWAYDTYLLADFAADPQSGYAPLEVQFTDFSMNEPDGWQWDFENDGNMDATDQNPQWTYDFPGTYDVRLVISKGTDTDTIVRNNFIVVGVSNPITIAEARLQPLGSIVTVTGIVTCGNEFGNLHFIQDPTAGAGIYDPNITDLRMGDSIVIMGETAEFNGLFELINNNYYAIISSNNALPAAQLVDVASLGEDYECEIVRINNVNFPYGGNSFLASTDYDLIDPSGTTHFRINGSSDLVFQRAPETTLDITGICAHRTDDAIYPYGIYGRDYADLIYKNLQDFQLQDAGFTKRYSMVNSVSAVDGNTAWAIAKDGKNQFNVQEIIRTTDAGQNWEVITVPNHDGLVNTSIFALDENNAWVMSYRQWGSNPQGIYYTGDGGVTWAHQSTATFDPTVGAFPDIVHFWDANTGVCMGDPSYGYFEIYTTSDGGATWSRVPQANIPDPLADEYGITDNYSVVDNTIWFTTTKGRIYKSADQGLNWTVYQTPISTYGIVDFKNQTDGLLISQNDNSLFETGDGGQNWSQITYTGDVHANKIKYVPGSPDTWVCSGDIGSDAGLSYSTDGGYTWEYFPTTHGVHMGAMDWVDAITAFIGTASTDYPEGGMFRYWGTGGIDYSISWDPAIAQEDQIITITVTNPAATPWLHWGVNDVNFLWQTPDEVYWPTGSVLAGGEGPAIQSPFSGPDENNTYTIQIGPFNDPAQWVDRVAFVIYFENNTWDNNNYLDYHVNIDHPQPAQVDLKVFLEGPFNGTDMNTDLNPIIPLQQTLTVIGYDGTEEVDAIPNNDVVDWIGVEFRDAPDVNSATEATTVGGGAFFLLRDGSIVDLDGSSLPTLDFQVSNQLFVVIWHRNHLPVMSKYPLTESGGFYTYDFTTSAGQAYGENQADLSGTWGMIGGDANADGIIDENDGYDSWIPQAGTSGYLQGDVNMDTQVNNQDKNDLWYPNRGKTEILPVDPAAWGCGDPILDSRDGQSYNTVQIGDQCWMAENLNVGDMIPGNQDQTNNPEIEKYCYEDTEANCDTYGGLYQWNEMMQYVTTESAQGICPQGWHLPSDAEWIILEEEVESTIGVNWNTSGWRGADAGGNLKEIGTTHWTSPNSGATNNSGFTGLPGGARYNNMAFYDLTISAALWTSSEDGINAWFRGIYYTLTSVYRYNGYSKSYGFSVRCIKD